MTICPNLLSGSTEKLVDVFLLPVNPTPPHLKTKCLPKTG